MSMQEHSRRYDARAHDPADVGGPDAAPSDCDCGDTIRELLTEIAGAAAIYVLIISIVRALQ